MVEASILVIGGGAIGGITAAKLAPAVRRVTVLDANNEHVAALRDTGLVYEEAGAGLAPAPRRRRTHGPARQQMIMANAVDVTAISQLRASVRMHAYGGNSDLGKP